MSNPDSKVNMLEHSEAKVSLFGRYLSAYLAILSNVKSVQNILIFDLLCGEGVYANGRKGSPIVALEAVKNRSYASHLDCPNIHLWFNDDGQSLIEPGVNKVDRVKEYVERATYPSNVQVEYSCKDTAVVLPKAIQKARTTQNSKSLFFLDPYGYSFTPEQVRDILAVGTTEVILFVPASFMYRFAKPAMATSFAGSEPLRMFIKALYAGCQPNFHSAFDFVEQSKERYRSYLRANLGVKVYVDTFTLEKGDGNVYSLFFFTQHVKGFEKMLEAKWAEDREDGRGHKANKSMSLFGPIELENYEGALLAFISSSTCCTNHDIFEYGLEHGFLPKHTNGILKRWLREDTGLIISALDGMPVRSAATYLSDRNRTVHFSFG